MYIKNPGGILVIIYKVIKYFIEERLKVDFLSETAKYPVLIILI